jgi:hypothetical protein
MGRLTRDFATVANRFGMTWEIHVTAERLRVLVAKCCGLGEGLRMARAARALGLETMVGNMIGNSSATAPAFLVGNSVMWRTPMGRSL